MLQRLGRIVLRAIRQPRAAWLSALWLLAGKPQHARALLLPARLKHDAKRYARWIEEFERRDAGGGQATVAAGPTISVVMAVRDPAAETLQGAIDSVLAQTYRHWELCIAGDASGDQAVLQALAVSAAADQRIEVVNRREHGGICRALNAALERATGEIVVLLDDDGRLAPDALLAIAGAAQAHPDADVFYTDEDEVDAAGRRFSPHFKPDWNRELFLAQNYLGRMTAVRRREIDRVGGFRSGYEGSHDHDLILRVVGDAGDEKVHHVARVLHHRRLGEAGKSAFYRHHDEAGEARRRCVGEYLAAMGADAEVVAGPGGCNRIVRRVPVPAPLVTMIVPTRDQYRLLRRCVESLLRTDYPHFEIIVVDNGTTCAKAAAYLKQVAGRPGCRVIADHRPFNFAALNNMAVAAARGEYVAFINDDVEAMDGGWLAEMVSHAVLPDVGAVGCKLLYDDGRIQHAGVILGIGRWGIADHGHKCFDQAASGYFFRPHLQQYASAVTAACMVVSKAKFQQAGGFDAEHLAVAYNDVDLCLRLAECGYRNYYTPHAVLHHRESMSRGRARRGDKARRFAGEAAYMKQRWGDRLALDPYYNPNLCPKGTSFDLRRV